MKQHGRDGYRAQWRLYRELQKKLRAGQAYAVTAGLSLLAEDQPADAPVWTLSKSYLMRWQGLTLRIWLEE